MYSILVYSNYYAIDIFFLLYITLFHNEFYWLSISSYKYVLSITKKDNRLHAWETNADIHVIYKDNGLTSHI
jgi:hypothetical protein